MYLIPEKNAKRKVRTTKIFRLRTFISKASFLNKEDLHTMIERYLERFSCDFFNRTPKINMSQTSSLWVNLWDSSGVNDCNNNLKHK